MKNLLISLFAFAPCVASASICSQFNGHFLDDQGHKQTLRAAADCKSLTWQIGAETKMIMTDNFERKVSQDFARYDLFVKASFENNHELTLTYRLQDEAGSVLSQSKSVYEITVSDLVRLTETNFAVTADGKETQQSQKVLLQVH